MWTLKCRQPDRKPCVELTQVAACGEETRLDVKVHLGEEGQTDVWAVVVGLRS